MGLGQLSLLLTWSFIEVTILIIIPLLRFNHLHNSLVLKYFLVQSIGSITLLTRLIFLFRLFDQKSLFLLLIVWKVALVFVFILPPDSWGASKRRFGNLFKHIKNVRKKEHFKYSFYGPRILRFSEEAL